MNAAEDIFRAEALQARHTLEGPGRLLRDRDRSSVILAGVLAAGVIAALTAGSAMQVTASATGYAIQPAHSATVLQVRSSHAADVRPGMRIDIRGGQCPASALRVARVARPAADARTATVTAAGACQGLPERSQASITVGQESLLRSLWESLAG